MVEPLEQFVATLVPSPYDRKVAATRREGLEKLLSTASIQSQFLFESGSWSHGTGIAAKSDVDYMAWIDSPRPDLPSSALARLHRVIDDTYDLDVYEVKTTSPVVAVEFFTSPHFEIVPAYYQGSAGDFPMFWIPGRGDEWVLSAPDAHLAYVDVQNDRLDRKLKSLVRLIKAWKHHVDAPASSFYLEMRTAEYAAAESSLWFDIDLPALFHALIATGVRDMNDPAGLVGRIPACSSQDKRQRTLSLMRAAATALDGAAEARRRRDAHDYWSHMYDVFGPSFPYPSW